MLKITGVKPGQEVLAEVIVLMFIGIKDPANAVITGKVNVAGSVGDKRVYNFDLESDDFKQLLSSEQGKAYVKAYQAEKTAAKYHAGQKLNEVETGTLQMICTQIILDKVVDVFEFTNPVTIDVNSEKGWSDALETITTPINWYVTAVTAPTIAETPATEEPTTPPAVTTAPPAVATVETPVTETPASTPTSEVALPVTSTPEGIVVGNQEVFSNLLGLVAVSQKAQEQTMEALLKQMQATNKIVEGLHQILTPTVVAEQQA